MKNATEKSKKIKAYGKKSKWKKDIGKKRKMSKLELYILQYITLYIIPLFIL